jgi:hypothetical protein
VIPLEGTVDCDDDVISWSLWGRGTCKNVITLQRSSVYLKEGMRGVKLEAQVYHL